MVAPSKLPFPLGADYSRHNFPINEEGWRNGPYPIKYLWIRTGISWGYKDPLFEQMWDFATRMGIPKAPYHVVYPGESSKRQVDFLKSILDGRTHEGPICWDVELSHNVTAKSISRCVGLCISEAAKFDPRMPSVYSRPYFVKDHLLPASWWNEVWWHMAHYLDSGVEFMGKNIGITGFPWDRVLIRQTTCKCDGALYGQRPGSKLDLNRWIGTTEQYNAFWGIA